jgi:hypothetical protein
MDEVVVVEEGEALQELAEEVARKPRGEGPSALEEGEEVVAAPQLHDNELKHVAALSERHVGQLQRALDRVHGEGVDDVGAALQARNVLVAAHLFLPELLQARVRVDAVLWNLDGDTALVLVNRDENVARGAID